MFVHASSFNQDISSWNVSKVWNMYGMFSHASSFNQDIGNWDVSNVTDIYDMFNAASSFNQDLSSWDVSKVTNMDETFDGSNLSTDNYDKLLTAWSQLNLQQNVVFGAINTSFCNGETAKQSIIDNFGWTFTDTGLDCATASTEDISKSLFTIYPNPTTDVLFINGNTNPTGISVYNVLGKEVISQTSNTVDVRKLPKGFYFIKIKDELEENIQKFIKK